MSRQNRRKGAGICRVCGKSYYANTRYSDGQHFHDKFGVCSSECWKETLFKTKLLDGASPPASEDI